MPWRAPPAASAQIRRSSSSSSHFDKQSHYLYPYLYLYPNFFHNDSGCSETQRGSEAGCATRRTMTWTMRSEVTNILDDYLHYYGQVDDTTTTAWALGAGTAVCLAST